jgi:hypothetical protein
MQALNASAISAAENNIACFMRIPFDCFTIAARLDMFAAPGVATEKYAIATGASVR